MRRRWLVALPFVLALPAASIQASAAPESGERSSIRIESDRDFTRANGVRSGNGTARNPYVISGWNTHHVSIENTSKAVRIAGNRIGSLTLNFIGSLVEVRDNDIGDLRVNENVPRTGMPTAGTFTRNRIGSVGQIRHFDGRFTDNVVGTDTRDTEWSRLFGMPEVVNIDGFNGGRFERNTIYGSMVAQLHGHHHSSGFGKSSHMHAEPASAQGHGHGHEAAVDHTKRFHELTIANNTIYTLGWYALVYTDQNHSANDRTAASEPDESLEKPHAHRTRVAITGNKLVGGGLAVSVFNAEDDRHEGAPQGWLTIARNTITLSRMERPFTGAASTGISIESARHLALRLIGNAVTGPAPTSDPVESLSGSGIHGLYLARLDHAHVFVDGLRVGDMRYGVRASSLTETVHWRIRNLRTSGVEEPVAYDQSVANEPDRR